MTRAPRKPTFATPAAPTGQPRTRQNEYPSASTWTSHSGPEKEAVCAQSHVLVGHRCLNIARGPFHHKAASAPFTQFTK